jgi:hypothetical protein
MWPFVIILDKSGYARQFHLSTFIKFYTSMNLWIASLTTFIKVLYFYTSDCFLVLRKETCNVLQELLFMEGLLHMNYCAFQKQIHYIMNIALWPAQLNSLMMYSQQLTIYIVTEGSLPPLPHC